jgi:hypothetical protein
MLFEMGLVVSAHPQLLLPANYILLSLVPDVSNTHTHTHTQFMILSSTSCIDENLVVYL